MPHPGAFRGGPLPGHLPEPPVAPGPPLGADARGGRGGSGSGGGGGAKREREKEREKDKEKDKDNEAKEREAKELKDKEENKEKAEREKGEKERAELTSDLTKMTAKMTFQEVRSNFDASCSDLKSCIKKLDKLLRKVRRKRHEDIALHPPCAEFSRRIFDGLKHVLVLCGTG
ncbi:hypothetical protein MNEG_13769 [Monoraphidium neglectum]|uniref:Uncharacterized protein n=1 Tax=Monoraphidium neglectum TaxID=145388 RepID=A0A0D2J2L7_9CHLO|nr:hypothetical protein MNEG_13769 [Monoraphidium neglectum]KIY94192.1 hypothetical protein MNEG_13769 [Monoraphidium neglectum]|eukprot:XP_013893212.1 hypothetical protein MNEG_13769 [Monoraphidium neglectum]